MSTLAPFGFQAGQSRRSVNEYYVPASDVSAYAVGDPVRSTGNVFVGRLPDSRQSNGMLHVGKAASGNAVRGVVVGVVAGPGDNSAQSVPAIKQRAYTLLVNDNPQALWDVQANNTATLSVMGGMYASYTVGGPLGSVSSTAVDASSIGTDVNDLLIAEVLTNTGANSLLRVAFVQHEMAAAGGSPQIGASIQALVSDAGNARVQSIGLMDSQPMGIARPVRSAGAVVAGFGTGLWLSGSEATNHTSTQGYTGFDANGAVNGIRSRTGQAEMLKVVCNNNTATNITLQSPGTNILTALTAGKLMLAVYVETQPGYQAGGTVAGNITLEVTTAAGVFTNALAVGWNSNQVREGWNFLKFVQRDPLAYQTTSPTTEYHPFGISAACYGTGAAANIRDNAIAGMRIATQNLSGATLYFDSIWTAWDHQAQIVLGCDSVGNDLIQYGLPRLQEHGWIGYVAPPARIWVSGSKLRTDWTPSRPSNINTMYDAGWECVNHTTNHLANGTLTSAAEVDYEIAGVQALYSALNTLRGNEFYASPQSSSSRLAEAVIRNRGIRLQRHARKSNVSVTPWGVDNIHHVGAIDMGSVSAAGVSTSIGAAAGTVAGWQTFTKIRRYVDVLEAYGDTGMPFWHGITTLGDSGSGDDLTGDNLLLTKSAFDKTIAYIAEREAAGGIRVRDGIGGFYYGTGR